MIFKKYFFLLKEKVSKLKEHVLILKKWIRLSMDTEKIVCEHNTLANKNN